MNGGWLGKFIRIFDQYLGAWVGMILASTILMGWVEKMFVWRLWDPEKEMFRTVPMFPTPERDSTMPICSHASGAIVFVVMETYSHVNRTPNPHARARSRLLE